MDEIEAAQRIIADCYGPGDSFIEDDAISVARAYIAQAARIAALEEALRGLLFLQQKGWAKGHPIEAARAALEKDHRGRRRAGQ